MDSLLTAGAVLLVASWLVPFHVPPWVAAQSEMAAAASAWMLALATMARSARNERLVVPAPALFFAVLAFIPVLQAAAGQIVFAGDAWIAALYLGCAASAVLWSAGMSKGDGASCWSRVLATAILVGALLSSVIVLLQRMDVAPGWLRFYLTDVRPGYPPGGNLAQPNQLATLLGLGLAALALLFEQQRVHRAWALTGGVVLAVAMAATQSRTPLLLFIAAVPTIWLLRRRVPLRTHAGAALGLSAVWGAAYVGWFRLASALDVLAPNATLALRAKAGPRTALWQQMVEAISLRPWGGYGWNQVSNAQAAVIAGYEDSRPIEHSHSLPLDLLVWNGVPLGALIMLAGLVWLWRAHRRVQSPAGVFGLLVVVVLLAHALVEFPLEYLYFLVPFGMAVGIVAADAAMAGARITMPRWGATALATVHIVLLAWASIDYMQVESAYREMRFAVARYGRPMPPEPPAMLQTQFTQLAAQHRAWLTTPRPGMRAEDVRLLIEVGERYGSAPLIYRQALAQGLNGDIEGARAALLRLRHLHQPKYIDAALDEIRRLAETEHPELRALLLP